MNSGKTGASISDEWTPPRASGALDSTVSLPRSKSITNRALVLAALSMGSTTVLHPLLSRDTELMIDALRVLGARVEVETDRVTVGQIGTVVGGDRIMVGNAGTVLRFLLGVAALSARSIRFDGDERIRKRPIAPLVEALRHLGADITASPRGGLPVVVNGSSGLNGGSVELDASSSSQFVSALLLVGALCETGLDIGMIGGRPPSSHHIQMTIDMLAQCGVQVTEGPSSWSVAAGVVRAPDFDIEPDLSSAAPFVAAALVTGGRLLFPAWPKQTNQPGDQLKTLAMEMGAKCFRDSSGLAISGPERIGPLDVDLGEVGELAPVLAATLCFATGPSRLRGIGHLRGHESNRLAALAKELSGLGPTVFETADGLIIIPAPIRAGTFETHDDHRLVMAGAVAALGASGVSVTNPATVGKTFPNFVIEWSAMFTEGR